MKKGLFTTAFLAVFIILSTSPVEANSVVRVGESVAIASEQTAEGNLYAVGSSIAVSGAVSGDAHLVGLTTTLNGKVASDTLMVGGSVTVDGEVGEDARIVGGEVLVSGRIRGDLFVIAGKLTILSTAEIDGDVLFFGQDGEVSGSVGGGIIGNMSNLRLDGPVAGTVEISTGQLILGERTSIGGDVKYTSTRVLTRAPAANIDGTVVKNDQLPVDTSGAWRRLLSLVLTLLFGALLWYLLLRRSLEELVATTTSSYLRSGLIGLALLFVMPFLATLLMVSKLGVWLGIMLMALFLFLLLVAAMGVIPVLGNWLRQFFFPKTPFRVLWLLAGSVLLSLFLLAPSWVFVIPITVLCITLGALSERLYHSIK